MQKRGGLWTSRGLENIGRLEIGHHTTSSLAGTELADNGSVVDWVRLKQKDTTHDALRPPSLPCPQPQRRRPTPHAQQDVRRRDRTCRIVEKAGRDSSKGEGAWCQGYEQQGEGYYRVMMNGRGEGDDCAERSAAQDRSSILAMVVPSIQSTEGILLLWQLAKY